MAFLESFSPLSSLTLTQTIYTANGTSPSLQVTGLESGSQWSMWSTSTCVITTGSLCALAIAPLEDFAALTSRTERFIKSFPKNTQFHQPMKSPLYFTRITLTRNPIVVSGHITSLLVSHLITFHPSVHPSIYVHPFSFPWSKAWWFFYVVNKLHTTFEITFHWHFN